MSHPKVQVTYSAPLIFLSSDQWAQVRLAIAAQFPLRDLTWKPTTRPAVRTIDELDVELVALDSIREEHASQIPQSLLEKPFLNLYIVTCEDTDAYKNSVRRQIRDWHANVTQRKNQEWLILLVVRPDARAAAGGFFAMKSSVLDKIKSDFNSDRRDRCVQIVWTQNAMAAESHADFTAKVKEGIMSAFDSAVAQRSEEVKKSESQRQMPGWNFCTFFILKESLASSFVGMSLSDDAILTYSELEASFLQAQNSALMGQRTISWFGKLINPDPKDDSLPLLDIEKKPYRKLLLSNTISLFDFRVYLLAKHCQVLGLSGRLNELAKKVTGFLGSFTQRLRECDILLPKYFIESWIFSSSLNVVSECDRYAALFELNTATIASFSAAKGELIELARVQLDKIGISAGHLPRSPPFSMSLSPPQLRGRRPPSPTEESSQKQITNSDIIAALADQDAFDKLYVDITNRAIEMYVKGGRRKFALKLHGSLAALDMHRARHPEAHQVYASLPAHYTPHSWTSLATFMQARKLDTHGHLEKPHDAEWIETVLAFLKGLISEAMDVAVAVMERTDAEEYLAGLLHDITTNSANLEHGIVSQDHPILAFSIKNELAWHNGQQDGSFIDVVVTNTLPCHVSVDDIRIFAAGKDSEQLVFSGSSQVFQPGDTTVTLFCPCPSFGLYVLEASEVSLSLKLTLRWNHQFHPKHGVYPIRRQPSSLIRIPKDFDGVDVLVELPRKIQLDAAQSLLLTIFSGRNNISSAIVKLPSSMGIEFYTKRAETIVCQNATLSFQGDGIRISGFERNTQIQVRVPHAYHQGAEPLKVVIDLEYISSEAVRITRQGRFIRQITTALPLVIQAHDHFRGQTMISDFSIATSPGTYQHLRISSAKLESVEDEQGELVITGCNSVKRDVITVTPNQPAHFLFKLESQSPRRAYASMHLSIGYRLLREEIEALLDAHITSALEELNESRHLLAEIRRHIVKALENDGDWVALYNATRELRVKQSALPKLPSTPDSAVISKVAETVIERLANNHPMEVEDLWREVVVPVDLPFKNVVSAAQICLHPAKYSPTMADVATESTSVPLYAGQPIAAMLTISTSFHWCGPGSQISSGKHYAMRFDIIEMPKDWLISGRKRGDFDVKDGSVYAIPLTLIPLRHGELRLPEVNVHPLPLTSGEMTMGSMALPSAESYQAHGAERVLILPRGGRTTFVVGMGT